MAARTISAEEANRIDNKLSEVVGSLLALQKLAINEEVDIDTMKTIVDRITRTCVRSIDACGVKLGGARMGFFDDEFEVHHEH